MASRTTEEQPVCVSKISNANESVIYDDFDPFTEECVEETVEVELKAPPESQ